MVNAEPGYALTTNVINGFSDLILELYVYNLQMAASVVMTIPVILLFFFAQRYFMRGIVTTGLAAR